MGRIQNVVLIMPVITTTLKYSHAVDEARMLQPPHNAASPRSDRQRPGASIRWLQADELVETARIQT